MSVNSKWIVHIKDERSNDCFEITVLREDNEHGIESYGWIDEDKLLISSSGGASEDLVTEKVWDKLVRVACEVARELNQEEFEKKGKLVVNGKTYKVENGDIELKPGSTTEEMGKIIQEARRLDIQLTVTVRSRRISTKL